MKPVKNEIDKNEIDKNEIEKEIKEIDSKIVILISDPFECLFMLTNPDLVWYDVWYAVYNKIQDNIIYEIS